MAPGNNIAVVTQVCVWGEVAREADCRGLNEGKGREGVLEVGRLACGAEEGRQRVR